MIENWQISRVCAELHQLNWAIQYTASVLKLYEKNNLKDLFISVHEGLAMSYAITKDKRKVKEYLQKVYNTITNVEDEEDKKNFMEQLVVIAS